MKSEIRDLLPDRPISTKEHDILGFLPMANHIAEVVKAETSSAGLVIGIEGKWGSGKTSLVNLTVESLQSNSQSSTRTAVLWFRPWMVGSKEALLRTLFSELSATIEARANDNGGVSKKVASVSKGAADKIRKFTAKLDKVGKLLQLADDATAGLTPGLGFAAKTTSGIAELAKNPKETETLTEAKEALSDSLRSLPYRILVIVDDADRLEPSEALEVIRLIRAVADFPNVIYLLCYDQDILSQNLETILGIKNGGEFLEKIVQGAFPVPLPESFSLRRWFLSELSQVAYHKGVDQERLEEVIDYEGGVSLSTARSVARTLNAVRIMWPSLVGRVDFCDFVWIQLIRISSPSLYRWVEEYMRTIAAISSGTASVPAEYRERKYRRLEKILSERETTFKEACWELSKYLPGIGLTEWEDSKKGVPIFKSVEERAIEEANRQRRLASPEHYRLYFALTLPQGVPSETEIGELIAALNQSPDEAGEFILANLSVQSDTKVSKAELMLAQLVPQSKRLSATASRNCLIMVANVMDKFAMASGRDGWGSYRTWYTANRVASTLIKKFSGATRTKLLIEIFREGTAIGWLTRLYRTQKSRIEKDDDPNRFLSKAEISSVTGPLRKRFKTELEPAAATVPDLLDILYAWRQMGHEKEVSKWIQVKTKSDDDFATVLEMMRTWANINGKVLYQITKENVNPLLDFASARERCERISRKTSASSNLRRRAAALVKNFDTEDE